MIRKFFIDSAIYTIPTILSTGISFFLIPLYTRVLTPNDYGAFDIIIIFGTLIGLTVALEISQGLARFFHEEETEEGKKNIASTAFWFTLINFTFFLISALFFTHELSLIILGISGMEQVFQIGLIYIWFNGIFIFVKNQLRWEFKSREYSFVSIIHCIITAFTSLILTYIYQFGIYGLLFGLIIGSCIGSIFALLHLRTTLIIRFDIDKLKKMLYFSIPLVPSSIAVFISVYIDRIMINHYLSLKEVGIYGIGFRMASISTLAIIGFQTALTPLIYKHYNDAETPNQLEKIFRFFTSIVLIIFLILSLFSDIALWFLTTPAYYPARDVIVFLVPAIILSQMYIFAPGLGIAKKTHIAIWINIFGAIINTFLNYILIPSIGYVGAAIATMVGYGCVFGIFMMFSQRFYYVPHKWKAIVFSVFIAGILAFFGMTIQIGFYEDILFRFFLIAIMIITFVITQIIKKEEIYSLYRFISKNTDI